MCADILPESLNRKVKR